MNDAEFMAALCGESRDFDRATGWLMKRAFVGPAERAAVVSAAIRTLASSVLSGREIDRRCRVVIESVRHDEGVLMQVVTGVQGVQPSALNAIRGALPAHLRPLAVARTSQAAPVLPRSEFTTTSNGGDEAVPRQVEQISQQLPTVVLVGTEVEHSGNKAMLNYNRFEALRVASLEKFWDVASTGICGFVIAPSAWVDLDQAVQRVAVERLCSWSTFTFARLALDGLNTSIASTIPSLLEAAGRAAPDRFCHSSDARLTAADIALLRTSATLLVAADDTRFVPLDVLRGEALLLRLIAGHRRPIDGAVEVRRLGAAQMHGGMSGARVFMLQMQSEPGRRIVVKLDERARLRQELERYQRWIATWEPNVTDPVLHHHEGRSAISYRLQTHPDGSDRPAPTLESELERLRNTECWDYGGGTDDAIELGNSVEAALVRAADRLAELNKRTANGAGESFWLHKPTSALTKRSANHEIMGHNETVFDLSSIVDKAVQHLAPIHDRAVVHGDIHGRNILLVDRLPAFIDYSLSGPGNPLSDLVRLDATVRHRVMRAMFGEKALTELFVALYVEGKSAADLLAQNPSLAALPTCRLCLNVAAKTRACAIEVAESFGHGLREYLSMVAVVAANTLALQTPGSAVERAVLAATAPTLMKDEMVPSSSVTRAFNDGDRAEHETAV